MTTWKELLDNFVPDERFKSWPDLEAFTIALDLQTYDLQDPEDHLKQYWVPHAFWCCTDTWVGLAVYVLHGSVVAVSAQSARKSDLEIEFVSQHAAEQVRKYLESLRTEEAPPSVLDLDEEVDEGWFKEGSRNGNLTDLIMERSKSS